MLSRMAETPETPREKAQRKRREQQEIGEQRRRKREDERKAKAGEAEPELPENAEQLERIRERSLDYIDKVWTGDQTCPICGHEDWSLGDISLLAMRSGDVGTPQANRGYPLVPVTCDECGYTFFINEQWAREGGQPSHVREQRESEESEESEPSE